MPFPPDAWWSWTGSRTRRTWGRPRTAEAAGAGALVTRERRAAGVTAAAVRASAGALEHLPHAVVANIPRALDRLRTPASPSWAWTATRRSILDTDPPDGRVAVVVGSEGKGMSRLVRERCDPSSRSPIRGRVGSLNASAALAAALYGFVLPGVVDSAWAVARLGPRDHADRWTTSHLPHPRLPSECAGPEGRARGRPAALTGAGGILLLAGVLSLVVVDGLPATD